MRYSIKTVSVSNAVFDKNWVFDKKLYQSATQCSVSELAVTAAVTVTVVSVSVSELTVTAVTVSVTVVHSYYNCISLQRSQHLVKKVGRVQSTVGSVQWTVS